MKDPPPHQAILFPAFTWDYAVTASGKHGFGLVARRRKKKGQRVFDDSLEYTFADVIDGDILLLDRNESASKRTGTNVPPEFPLMRDTLLRTHGVPRLIPDPTGKTGGTVTWHLEVPGLLMNHSCEPNVQSYPRTSDKAEDYAFHHVGKGEELTVDYALQYYDEGPLFEECACGSSNCRGKMMGFKALSDADKKRLFSMASDAVQAMHRADTGLGPPVKKEQELFPPRNPSPDARLVFPGPSNALAEVIVKRNEGTGDDDESFYLYALKDFAFGEKVYEYWAQPWPLGGKTPVDMSFASPLAKGDPKEGTVVKVDPRKCASRDRSGQFMFSGWDLLTAHSCEPNLVYTDSHGEDDEDDWRGAYAARDIRAGDRLTMDYNCMMWDRAECGESLNTCNCGATNCTGTQKGFKFLSREAQQERKFMSWKRVPPPYEGHKGKVIPGEALFPHVRESWRNSEHADDAPDTGSSDDESSSSESDSD